MITDSEVESALKFMACNGARLGQAKGERVYLEQFRKSKKALLFAQAPDTIGDGADSRRATVADRENWAYSHPDYLELLEGLKVAVETEESLRWQMTAAEYRVDVYRTQQANARRLDGAAA